MGLKMNGDKYILSSVYHVLEILDLLAQEQILGVAEISSRLKLNKTSVFRYLYTLESGGYVYKTSDAKYVLGKKFVYMGSIVGERQTEFSLARPELVKLRDQVNETVHLSILLSDFTIMFIDKVSGNQTLQMRSQIGYQIPAYCSGSGKVLLAGVLGTEREAELENIKLVKKTENTIVSYPVLLQELKKIKEQGYGEEAGEAEEGLSCIAVPVRNLQRQVIAAVSISGATIKFQERREKYVASLKETAQRIEQILGL